MAAKADIDFMDHWPNDYDVHQDSPLDWSDPSQPRLGPEPQRDRTRILIWVGCGIAAVALIVMGTIAASANDQSASKTTTTTTVASSSSTSVKSSTTKPKTVTTTKSAVSTTAVPNATTTSTAPAATSTTSTDLNTPPRYPSDAEMKASGERVATSVANAWANNTLGQVTINLDDDAYKGMKEQTLTERFTLTSCVKETAIADWDCKFLNADHSVTLTLFVTQRYGYTAKYQSSEVAIVSGFSGGSYK